MMLRYSVVFVVVAFALQGRAHALCQPGEQRACVVNGQPGMQVCQANAQFGPCMLALSPTSPDDPSDDPPDHPPPQTYVVAYSEQPNGLAASTGNLYWTHNDPPTGAGVSAVMRAAKTNSPGDEIELYSEAHAGGSRIVFGDIVLPNTSFAYFTASYSDDGERATTQIKRVPLAGGEADVVKTLSLNPTAHSLSTDGVSLFWLDSTGIRSMPVSGGAIATLVAASNIHVMAPDGAGRLVFVVGAGAFRRVSTLGGTVVSLFEATGKITALYATSAQVYWGTSDGAVHSHPNASVGVDSTHQPPLGPRTVVSIGFDGARILWADCNMSATGCIVRTRVPGAATVSVVFGLSGVGHIQWDASRMFWHDLTMVRRFYH